MADLGIVERQPLQRRRIVARQRRGLPDGRLCRSGLIEFVIGVGQRQPNVGIVRLQLGGCFQLRLRSRKLVLLERGQPRPKQGFEGRLASPQQQQE